MPFKKNRQRNLKFQSREGRANAKVNAAAKRKVFLDCARWVKAVWISPTTRITARGTINISDLITAFECHAV